MSQNSIPRCEQAPMKRRRHAVRMKVHPDTLRRGVDHPIHHHQSNSGEAAGAPKLRPTLITKWLLPTPVAPSAKLHCLPIFSHAILVRTPRTPGTPESSNRPANGSGLGPDTSMPASASSDIGTGKRQAVEVLGAEDVVVGHHTDHPQRCH